MGIDGAFGAQDQANLADLCASWSDVGRDVYKGLRNFSSHSRLQHLRMMSSRVKGSSDWSSRRSGLLGSWESPKLLKIMHLSRVSDSLSWQPARVWGLPRPGCSFAPCPWRNPLTCLAKFTHFALKRSSAETSYQPPSKLNCWTRISK